MSHTETKQFGLSGTALKVIAAISMFIDHSGLMLFPHSTVLRIIGRLAFPIFAFLFYVGCLHTRNKVRHFAEVFLLGVVCVAVQYLVTGELFLNILITLSLSSLIIYSVIYAFEKSGSGGSSVCFLLPALAVMGAYALCLFIYVDYGFWGVMLPVFPALFDFISRKNDTKKDKLPVVGWMLGTVILALHYGGIQLFCLFAFIPVYFYNGKRGSGLPKYFFYFFYPGQYVILWLVLLAAGGQL